VLQGVMQLLMASVPGAFRAAAFAAALLAGDDVEATWLGVDNRGCLSLSSGLLHLPMVPFLQLHLALR